MPLPVLALAGTIVITSSASTRETTNCGVLVGVVSFAAASVYMQADGKISGSTGDHPVWPSTIFIYR